MSSNYDEQRLHEMAEELAKGLKTEDDVSELSRKLMKITMERALKAELNHHLGYKKNASAGINTGNSRNGSSQKTLKSDSGELTIEIPRDRNGDFEPQLIKKHQTRTNDINSKILTLFAKGMSTRDISDAFQEIPIDHLHRR